MQRGEREGRRGNSRERMLSTSLGWLAGGVHIHTRHRNYSGKTDHILPVLILNLSVLGRRRERNLIGWSTHGLCRSDAEMSWQDDRWEMRRRNVLSDWQTSWGPEANEASRNGR